MKALVFTDCYLKMASEVTIEMALVRKAHERRYHCSGYILFEKLFGVFEP